VDLSLSLKRAISPVAKQEAIVDGHHRFTYERFGHRVAALAHWLRGFRHQKGHCQLPFLAPNCHEFMEAYYACAVTGIVLNPLNHRPFSQ